MRQVDYTGFGWAVVEVMPEHRSVSSTSLDRISYGLKPELKQWLKTYKSGGYFSIQSRRYSNILLGGKIYYEEPKTISFSRKSDAMMFMWQCL